MMRARRLRAVPPLAGLLVIALMLVVRALFPDPFARLRLATFDNLQRLEPWRVPNPQVEVVDIDDASLQRYGQWPWPRTVVAAMTRTLQDAGAAAIAFDVVFAEPDHTSPSVVAAQWAKDYGWTSGQGGAAPLPDHDKALASVFARGRVVTGFGLVPEPNGSKPVLVAGFATIGGDPASGVRDFHGAVTNLSDIEGAAAGNGTFSIVGGRDNIVRRMPLLASLDGKLMPSLALEALRVAQDEDTIKIRTEHQGGPAGPVLGYTVRVGAVEMPLDVDGALQVHQGEPGSQPTLPAWRVLESASAADIAAAIKGRIVLVGTSATGLSDLRSTPLNPFEPGVNLHARAIEQVLAKHFLARPAWALGFEVSGAVLISGLLVALAGLCGMRMAILAATLAGSILLVGTSLAFSLGGLLLDPSLILLTVLASTVTTALGRYFVIERDASRLRSAFTHYLSPQLVAALARDPDRLKLGGELREMTFLFTDLEGFTTLMEKADPERSVSLLNAYLDGLCRIAIEHGGTVDKIVGDALHVMFNAPLDQPDHAERAVRCALSIDSFAQDFAAEQKAKGLTFGVTRIGVNTGQAVVGNFGGSRRFDYTAHGDAINTAARLESANKALGTRICVAKTTADRAPGVAFVSVGHLMLKGKTKAVEVLMPCADLSDLAGWMREFQTVLQALSDGQADGATALLALQSRHPAEPILALHAARLRAGEAAIRLAA